MSHYLTLLTQSSAVHYITQSFQRLMGDKGCDVHSIPCFFSQEFMKLFWKVVPLSDLILSGVLCCHKMSLKTWDCVLSSGNGSQGLSPASQLLPLPWWVCTMYLACSWQWSTLPGLTILETQLLTSVPGKVYFSGLVDCSTCFSFINGLCNDLHGQVHPSVMSLSVCCSWCFMAPSGYK